MSEYIIFTDSSADFDQKMVEDLGVVVQPLTFTQKGNSYANWPDGRELSFKDFYAQLRAGEMSSTSQVNTGEFVDIFRPVLQQGRLPQAANECLADSASH